MKKTLIAVAALAATGAFAQVTVYGRLDAGYGSYTSTSSAGVDTKLAGVLSHNSVSSMWGIKGSEDLGGGMKANFILEQDLYPANGVAGIGGGAPNAIVTAASTTATGFNRTSLLGVSGGFGSVNFGRDYLPGFSVIAATDINGLSRMSTVQGSSYTGGSTVANQVVYTSPNLSGFVLKVAAVNDDRSVGTGTDTYKGTNFSATYSNGPLMVAVGAGSMETNTGTATKSEGSVIGAGYDFGTFALKGNYITSKSQAAGANDAKEINVGVTVPMGKVLLKAQVGSNDSGAATSNTGTDMVLGADYSLSAKTALYFTTGTVNKVGDNQKLTGTAVGIKTSF